MTDVSPILNYTTSVAVDKTVSQIQRILGQRGAKAVMVQYGDEGDVTSVAFQMDFAGQRISFVLPAQVDRVYVILQRARYPRMLKRYRTREHAARVAWRIVKDWVEAQVAMVQAGQVEMVEVFLPYAQHPETGETAFQLLRGNKLFLPAPVE